MKVNVQLFGVLGRKLPEYSSPDGVEVEVPDGSTAGDLLEYMKIPEDWGASVTMDSRLLRDNELIRDGAEIRLIQSVHGG